MLYIKTDKIQPINTGEYEGELAYNNKVIYKGKMKIVKLHRGVFNSPFEVVAYKINDNIYYYDKTDQLFNEYEYNAFCREILMKQIRRNI